jgi:glycosyltransferase involved in cell wall biosynthesis
MRILHIVAGMDPKAGGVTQAVRSMIEGLNALEEVNEVISLDSPSAPFLAGNKFPVYALGPAKTAWRYSSALLPWLHKNLKNYDTVIVHGLWQYHVYAILKAWKKVRIARPKLFVMPHGMLDPYFQKAKGRRFKAFRNLLFWQLSERRLVNHADCLLFTCETERLLSFRSFKPYRPKRTEIVGLGISEPPQFNTAMKNEFRQKCGGVDTEGCILYISRIDFKKGIDLLINAYISISEKGVSLPKLVIAGPGLEMEFGKEMQALASTNNSILFTGMLDGVAKWGAFYSCSVMILPSHQENFGFVVVEALACGKPVLISNQVNIWREIVKEGAGIVHDDTPAGTLQLLTEWQSLQQTDRQVMGKQARVTFDNYFSLSTATARLKEVIASFQQ